MNDNDFKKIKTASEILREYFFAELTLLKGVCSSRSDYRFNETRVVIASACSTGTAIHDLGDKPEYFYSEMIMLSRSFIEKITNFCYLQICEDAELEKFKLHPLYKVFHNADKSKHTPKGAVKIKYTGREKMRRDPNIAKALKLFSDTNPRKNWSNFSIDEKISLIAQKTNIKTEFFLLNTLSIYSNASEALHGSLYGCVLATGAYTMGVNHKNSSEVNENLFKNVVLIYAQLGSMTDELINFLNTTNKRLGPIAKASKKNQKLCLEVMKKIF